MDVRSRMSTFNDKELAAMSAGSKDKSIRLKTSSSCSGQSVTSKRSIDKPIGFKGKHEKSPGSTYSACESEKSSKDIPLHIRKEHEEKPGSTYCASEKSSKDIPLHFRKNLCERPDCDYSEYDTDLSSKDIPLHFDNKIKVPYGMPQSWGGQVICSVDAQRLKVQCPPPAVYPVLRTDHRVPDDLIQSRLKLRPSGYVTHVTDDSKDSVYKFKQDRHVSLDYPQSESIASSDTSDYSSSTTSGSRNSQYDEKTVLDGDIEGEVICDICCQTTAVKTCLTCNASYCEFDVRQHYMVKTLQRHRLIDVCDEVEGKRCLHYKKTLDFFCRTDQMLICSICAQDNHSGHDIVSQTAASQILGGGEYQNAGLPETVVPPPGNIKFLSVKPNSVVLSWEGPKGLEGPKNFRIKWSSCMKVEGHLVIKDFFKIEINHLQLGQKYFFSVATQDEDGNLSEWVTASVFTAVPPPQHLAKGHSEATALSVKWTKGDNMEGIPHQFLITVTSPGKEPLAIHTEYCYKILSGLEPDTEYIISVSAVLNDQCSEPVSITIHTEPCLREFLSNIGLEDQYDSKLTLGTVLEINQSDTSENTLETARSLPEAFLKKLMMLNANARSVRCVSYNMDNDKSNAINPLDLIIALFLCSDSFLQQVVVLKMALCQFAIPLLLPNHETREIILMLWPMREIVKTFRPSNQAFRKLSCEERIVVSEIPLVSFVRLGKTILSKSQMLNKLFSNTQQSHDTFYHRNMMCGDVPRRISDGLVEISWYLPCGNMNIDKFTEPLAIANLRGDIRAFDKQFSLLCQTSATIYIFCDDSEADYFKNLDGKDVKANVILISSAQGKTFTLKMMMMKPSLKTINVSQKKKTDTELIKALQESISKMLENCTNKVSVANLSESARGFGILVDEDSDECQSAWKNVGEITKRVTTTSEFKDKQLPFQGHIWKALSWLETECWRLRKAGNQIIEDYRKSLKAKQEELKKKQLRFQLTAAMSSFLHGVVTSEVQCYYFLKWLEIELDNLCHSQLSALQDQYKELSQKFPQDTEKIAKIDKQISVCSLRLDHFFRECGQLYECASYLPEYSCQRKTMIQQPALSAQMLLDGFPLELVDGDAANIPMKWITEVLTELHYIMQSNSKLKVITIIGAENSGKSTLLNTMFGARFAVSKGTCTRGAFIQLINVNKHIREELGCDCIMIIDTEGLKPYQMVQDDHSHERDKEVASLAAALSDITILSVPRDSSSEKDILELVLHALKNVERKPLCHFVHSYMSDMPTVERRSSKNLVELLNKMIEKDARMKKANVTKISDVMKIDSDTCIWHIPPIWHGTPPMAPFSIAYSETAHALKKQLLRDLKKCQERGDLTDFIQRVENLWKAEK